MMPEKATLQLNQEYTHNAHLLAKKKAIVDPNKVQSMIEFDVKVLKVSLHLVKSGCIFTIVKHCFKC